MLTKKFKKYCINLSMRVIERIALCFYLTIIDLFEFFFLHGTVLHIQHPNSKKEKLLTDFCSHRVLRLTIKKK